MALKRGFGVLQSPAFRRQPIRVYHRDAAHDSLIHSKILPFTGVEYGGGTPIMSEAELGLTP